VKVPKAIWRLTMQMKISIVCDFKKTLTLSVKRGEIS